LKVSTHQWVIHNHNKVKVSLIIATQNQSGQNTQTVSQQNSNQSTYNEDE